MTDLLRFTGKQHTADSSLADADVAVHTVTAALREWATTDPPLGIQAAGIINRHLRSLQERDAQRDESVEDPV
jgi:hypothetical protein